MPPATASAAPFHVLRRAEPNGVGSERVVVGQAYGAPYVDDQLVVVDGVPFGNCLQVGSDASGLAWEAFWVLLAEPAAEAEQPDGAVACLGEGIGVDAACRGAVPLDSGAGEAECFDVAAVAGEDAELDLGEELSGDPGEQLLLLSSEVADFLMPRRLLVPVVQ